MAEEEWGFFGHQRINRLAVFTLPKELISFYKPHIQYVTDHAVDPDMRRYAIRQEAGRHYIDLDVYPFGPEYKELPRTWYDALPAFTKLYFVKEGSTDTVLWVQGPERQLDKDDDVQVGQCTMPWEDYRRWFNRNIAYNYDVDGWSLRADTVKSICLGYTKGWIIAKDALYEHGILPYNLQRMQAMLTKAFEAKDVERILRLSAEMGHYIGDAHVPLHTTKNYNGQLTDQVGIHAFWESRLPELFADKEYDFLVGQASYINDNVPYFWDIILESNSLVEDVLGLEKQLQSSFPQDVQFCYEERNNITVRMPCYDYSLAYHQALNGMVEKRMQDAIRSIGSSWYTAWIDAGKPNLQGMKPEGIIEVQPLERVTPEEGKEQRTHDY